MALAGVDTLYPDLCACMQVCQLFAETCLSLFGLVWVWLSSISVLLPLADLFFRALRDVHLALAGVGALYPDLHRHVLIMHVKVCTIGMVLQGRCVTSTWRLLVSMRSILTCTCHQDMSAPDWHVKHLWGTV